MVTFNNNYYKLNNNLGANFLSQGLNFIGGGSSMGNYNIGNMLGCGSTNYFTDCYGEVNYDKVAGASVASALFNVGVQAFKSIKQEKGEKVDHKQELKDVTEQLNAKREESVDVEAKKVAAETNVDNANSTIKSLEAEKAGLNVSSLKTKFDDISAQYKAEQDPTNKAALEKQMNEAEQAWKKADAREKAIDAEIKKQNEIIATNETAIKDAKTKLESLDKEIRELEKAQETAQKGVNAEVLDKADGNWFTRAEKKCLDDSYGDDNKAKKNEVRAAFNAFVKAKKENNEADMKKYADKVVEMMNSNPKLEKSFGKALELIKPYTTQNK